MRTERLARGVGAPRAFPLPVWRRCPDQRNNRDPAAHSAATRSDPNALRLLSPHPWPDLRAMVFWPWRGRAKTLDLGERRARDGHERDVAMREMHGDAVGVVGHERATRATLLRARREHEVLHHELAAAVEQTGKRLPAVGPVEGVRLVDADPGKLPAQLSDLIAAPRQVLLGGKQIASRLKPSIPCRSFVG